MSKRTPRFVVYKAKDGWRWRLLAANNRIIATGEAHTRERDAWRAVDTVTSTVALLGIELVEIETHASNVARVH